jgi:hypothetical protein
MNLGCDGANGCGLVPAAATNNYSTACVKHEINGTHQHGIHLHQSCVPNTLPPTSRPLHPPTFGFDRTLPAGTSAASLDCRNSCKAACEPLESSVGCCLSGGSVTGEVEWRGGRCCPDMPHCVNSFRPGGRSACRECADDKGNTVRVEILYPHF